MLLWFVSTLLVLAYDFPDTELTDLEIDAAGSVWLLPLSDPAVIRIDPDGNQNRFETGVAGFSSGLSLSGAGKWVVSYRIPGIIQKYNHSDILLEEIEFTGSGDILLSGLNLWIFDTIRGNVVSSTGEVIARNCGNRDSRFSLQRTGLGLISGPFGVFLIEAGEIPVKLADYGSACFSEKGILLLSDGTLQILDGSILETELPYSRVSSSPDGKIVVLWGNSVPLVLE